MIGKKSKAIIALALTTMLVAPSIPVSADTNGNTTTQNQTSVEKNSDKDNIEGYSIVALNGNAGTISDSEGNQGELFYKGINENKIEVSINDIKLNAPAQAYKIEVLKNVNGKLEPSETLKLTSQGNQTSSINGVIQQSRLTMGYDLGATCC